MVGTLMPTDVSFYGADETVKCSTSLAAIRAQTGSGYIEDGHFSRYGRYYGNNVNNPNNNGVAMTGWFPTDSYRSPWQGAFYYVNEDRLNQTGSLSIRTNSSGGGAFQRMRLAHELPIEMVARAYLKYNLDNRSTIGILPPNQWVPQFVGIEVTIEYEDELLGEPGEVESFSYFASPSPWWEWQLIEVPIVPTRPIRWATMQIAARGFYFGYALFDDVSFRPAHDRICMCSTGFFYNYSDPVKQCQRCKPGFACSGGTVQRCANSWSCAATAGCQYCRDGWLCDSDGRGRHIPCARYTYKSNTTEQCFPCPMGHSCRDGIRYECNDGTYGDGGIECITCKPGFYSPKSGPQRQCLVCPPGHTSEAGRSSCFKCPLNHYSPNGTDCYSADVGFFVSSVGAAQPTSCVSPVMDTYSVTIPRNRHGYVIRVVPRVCLNHYSYEVSRSEDISNGQLGKVRLSKTSAAVLYDAGPHNFPQDTHVFRVYFTSNVNAIEQYATVTVRLTNTPMIGIDDKLWVPHPMEQDTTYRITTWLSNNINREHDWIWVQSVTAPYANLLGATPAGVPRVSQYDMGANPGALVGVDTEMNHPALTVTLPRGFRGPMHIRPITYDQYCPTLNADCLETSPHDVIRITARTRPPVAVNDFFRVQVGQVVPLDVVANDFDYENDLITIYTTTASSQTGYFPAVQYLCAGKGIGAACNGGCRTGRLYPGQACGCRYDNYEDRCRTVDDTQSEWFVDFASMTGACGLETFTYSIGTNDGNATGTVTVDNYRCYCDSIYYRNNPFNIIFVLDGTASISDYAAQLAFADGVIKRSSQLGSFYYGIIEAGSNVVNYALSSTYPDVLTMKRGDEGDEYVYALGAGITMAKDMYNTGVRNTWVVVISTKEGGDKLTGIKAALPLARYITFSVNPLNEHYLHWGEHFANIYYSRVVRDMAALNKEASIQEDLMDLMCGSGW